MKINIKKIGLFLGPIVFILIRLWFQPEGLRPEGNAILAGTVWIAIWWITEAIPIAATSLMPIILFPLTGGLSLADTTAAFGDKFVFLYAGGFMLAIAIERWNLHKRIALNTVNLIGTNIRNIILGFMIATGFLSMWISNTATAVMMLPIGMAVINQVRDAPETLENENQVFGKTLMLAIAYSSSIGGMATLIGTPPNLVLAGVIREFYGVELSFIKWLIFGLPVSIMLLFTCWIYLTRFAFKFEQSSFPGGRQEIRKQLKLLGKISFEERIILIVFISTAFAWITRSFLLNPLVPALDDTIIAIFAALILFLLPTKNNDRAILTWEEAVKLPWGILFLFGGGLAIADGFKSSGLAQFIGSQMTLLQGASIFIIVLLLIAAVNFLTEITSNLATTSMMLPILAPLALSIDVHPFVLMVGAALAASCAFMLPVATPPNAVVFGSGHLKISDMLKAGFVMNLLSIIILSLMVYFLLPLLWDIDPTGFPEIFKK